MTPIWKWLFVPAIYLFLQVHPLNSQTTTLPTTSTMTTEIPEVTTPTTTFVPTLTPLITTESSTLATADSELPTTTFATEQLSTAEATTKGQASNEALRASGLRRGYRFESTRNRPNANQQAEPEAETETPTTAKPEEKKIAWKFGRGGNNQEPWSSRPSPNSGYPVWKKETPTPPSGQIQEEQGASAEGNKPNDQSYIVWNVGQGNQPNGWTLSGNGESWAPAGAIPATGGWVEAGANTGNSPGTDNYNAGPWSEDQSPDTEAQGGWTGDDTAPDEGAPAGWNNGEAGAWNPQNQNAAVWINEQAQGPPVASWQPQGNGGGGPWVAPQQGNNGGGGWVAPQQGGGWVSQPQVGGVQGNPNGQWNNNNNGGSWNGPPPSTSTNSWNNGAPAAAANGGWNNGQQNGASWNNGATGSPGWQDGGLSWKVYNEDTKTMENIDDSSGWKVVGDGGPDGWKLVDENGNVEWKIENINGEWKVTSADDLSKSNDTSSSVSSSSVNDTSESTNVTSAETPTTTTAPTGGWDDDKQGRYIIWKFSEDGKGEARVYGGDGSEPEVWTVGDNNQWWKETMGVKEANTVVQGGWNSAGNNGQGNGGWQNTAPQADNSWKNGGGNTAQNNGWQASGPQSGTAWQQPPTPANGAGGWHNNGPPVQSSGNSWQGGGPQSVNRWQKKGGQGSQQKWNNGAAVPQNSNGWQNQAQPGGWNAGNTAPPQNGGWQNSGPTPQVAGGSWQVKPGTQQAMWQNGAAPNGGGWTNGGKGGGGKTKGRWRNNGNGPPGRWAPNNSRQNRPPTGKVWNSGNGWQTAPNVQQGKRAWSNNVPPSNGAPAATPNAAGRSFQNNAPQDAGWSANGGGGQTVPYIIIIKAPDAPDTGAANAGASPNPWTKPPNGAATTSNKPKNGNSNNRPQNNRRNSGWKMNRAGSSGWQWNPQGGNEGWKWRDGWMGSGGGFGGWMSDKGTMYSNWRPTRVNGAQARKSTIQRMGSDKGNKKSASKMVFVFGTKKNSGNAISQPTNKGVKKGKQVIIIDYTSGGKKVPKGDDGMKKDIESVIQALKTAKPTGVRGTAVWKQPGQKKKPQQRSR